MTRAELLRLAERVEKAEGADRTLDEAIYRALGYWWDADEAEWCAPDSPRAAEGNDVPAFTVCQNAAATLVPDHWNWEMHSSGLCRVAPSPHHPRWKGGGVRTQQTHAATPALALCAAALRALASEAGE